MNSIKCKAKGITLVSLVITIIVLLILSGVTINLSLNENGIFGKAKEATQEYENIAKREKEDIYTISNYINDYLYNEESTKPIESTLGLVTGEEKTNTSVNDKYGNKVVVPAGFKIINPNDDVTKGIVIQDVTARDDISKGNEFVWIPVGDVTIDSDGNKKNIALGRYSFDQTTGKENLEQSADNYTSEITINEYYQELENSDYGNVTARNLGEFIEKVKLTGGFYIGRYETGDSTAESKRTRDSSDTEPPVIQRGKWPYTFITQSQAASFAKEYYGDNQNFKSDLLNSYVWDTTLVFIQTFSGDSDYSRDNVLEHVLETTGNTKDQNNNYDVRCNIYDMSGNTYEWSTETAIDPDEAKFCVDRGGGYYYEDNKTYGRSKHPTEYNAVDLSFRIILYL